ncbi:hypothetical protein 2019_scaffold132_00012 [Bacteriophage sp.]|nr:hypothetical protein 2019_scaffold132_00012 [Bacteriophage sp.]
MYISSTAALRMFTMPSLHLFSGAAASPNNAATFCIAFSFLCFSF